MNRKEKGKRISKSRSRSPIRRYDEDRYNRKQENVPEINEKKNTSEHSLKSELYSARLPSSCTNSEGKDDHAMVTVALSQQNNDQTMNLKESSNTVSTSESYGPALPPTLKNKFLEQNLQQTETKAQIQHTDDDNTIRHHGVIGPALPPGFAANKSELEGSNSTSPDLSQYIKDTYGPALPSPLKQSDDCTSDTDEDEQFYGPLPPDASSRSKAHIALEERALQMKIDKLNPSGNDQITREEWMIELPEVHSKKFGLGPRQFRPNPAPDFSDRSSWTDTPENKAKKSDQSSKKVDIRKEAEIKHQEKYDKEQEKIAKKHKKHKKEKSLVEIHQSELKKKKEDEGPSTRRPFSRDLDLKVNRFDEAQKKAILKKAQLLDDRFSRGQSKFL